MTSIVVQQQGSISTVNLDGGDWLIVTPDGWVNPSGYNNTPGISVSGFGNTIRIEGYVMSNSYGIIVSNPTNSSTGYNDITLSGYAQVYGSTATISASTALHLNLESQEILWGEMKLSRFDDVVNNSGYLRFGNLNLGDGQNVLNNTGVIEATLIGGSGKDIISNKGKYGTISTAALGYGDDEFINTDGAEIWDLNTGAGHDKITNSAEVYRVLMEAGNDVYDGTKGIIKEFVNLGAGNDYALGGAGADKFYDGTGADTIYAGAGDDLIIMEQVEEGDYFDGGGGFDTIQLSGGRQDTNDGVTLDLRQIPENFGKVALTYGGSFYVHDIEAYLGTAKNDTMIGNDHANYLAGGAGNDVFEGGNGNDTLIGGDGVDLVRYGIFDTVVNLADGYAESVATGHDILQGIENVTTSLGNDSLVGNASDNVLNAGAGFDRLDGMDGNDHLLGGEGNDVLKGGAGNDTLDGGSGDDWAVYGDGGVTVDLSTGTATGEGNDTLRGIENIKGGAGADTLIGNEQQNILWGGAGDTMQAGLGDDIYIVTDANVVLYDTGGYDVVYTNVANWVAAEGSGIEKVIYDPNFSLPDNPANANLPSSPAYVPPPIVLPPPGQVIDGTPDSETLEGGGGNDTMQGGSGDDTMNGGAGDDTMGSGYGDDAVNGGDGNDTLDGGPGNDVLDGGNGNDSLEGGSGNDTLTGGEGDDSLSGGFGDDALFGAGGNDLLDGGVGNDWLEGGLGRDILNGGPGNDHLDGGGDDDFLSSGDGDDVLNGGGGADIMQGGSGNDTYFVDNALDQITEYSDGGTDRVFTTVSFSIADTAVENLSSAEGALNVNLTGNALNNVLTGDAGTNILNGGLGADTLNGGEGDDVYYVDDVNDVVTEAESGGHDKIYTTIKGFTASNVEEVIYIGPEEPPIVTPPVVTPPGTAVINENERILGTAGKDTLYGLNGNDTILGSGGNDYLDGGAGNDLLYGGAGKDTLKGGLGRDVFVFDTKPNKKTNMDKIADFNVKDDTIYLDNKYFKALGKKGSITKPAKMSSKMFYSGSKAHDKDDRIIYDKKKGVLYYDDDGIGSHKAVEIATLKKGLKLTYHDFLVI